MPETLDDPDLAAMMKRSFPWETCPPNDSEHELCREIIHKADKKTARGA